MNFPNSITRTNSFQILGVLGVFFSFIQIRIEHSVSKQWRPWSDAALCSVWSGSALFAWLGPLKRTLGLYGLINFLPCCEIYMDFCHLLISFKIIIFKNIYFRNTIRVLNSLKPDLGLKQFCCQQKALFNPNILVTPMCVLWQTVKTQVKYCILWHFIRVYTVYHARQNNLLKRKTQFYLEIITCDPSIYTLDHSKFLYETRRKNPFN